MLSPKSLIVAPIGGSFHALKRMSHLNMLSAYWMMKMLSKVGLFTLFILLNCITEEVARAFMRKFPLISPRSEFYYALPVGALAAYLFSLFLPDMLVFIMLGVSASLLMLYSLFHFLKPEQELEWFGLWFAILVNLAIIAFKGSSAFYAWSHLTPISLYSLMVFMLSVPFLAKWHKHHHLTKN